MCLSLNKMVSRFDNYKYQFHNFVLYEEKKKKGRGKKEKRNIITWQYPIARKKL